MNTIISYSMEERNSGNYRDVIGSASQKLKRLGPEPFNYVGEGWSAASRLNRTVLCCFVMDWPLPFGVHKGKINNFQLQIQA